ncbi:hypothetical protein HPT29_025350 (plasmid) [Microvirga terrae]|uniref:Cytochrome c domain-containing protein n=1 Tax=Microvirga terrae TaxID=2740529 RepID=A0ABY5RZ04_9HYPH|nr:hypothetical protein [Microvirga terrae]UVF22481.1 hypothetical protein HPT29_025350 [Microvirga terrae]
MKQTRTDGLEFGETGVNPLPIPTPLFRAERSGHCIVLSLKTFSAIRISQMPGIARQFEPQITRTGGAPSRYRFTARCSGCHKTDTYESSTSVGDDVVKGYFKDRGWLLARDRAHDLCSACLAKPHGAQPPRQRTDGRHHQSPEGTNHPDRLTPAADKRSRDTADILARHLGKPDALAQEVFRPKPVLAPRPSAADAPQLTAPVPAPPPEVQQALVAMAEELKGLRATMDLMAEQVGQLVSLGTQQIEAMARLTPLVVQSAEGISGSLRAVANAVQLIPTVSTPAGEATKPSTVTAGVEEPPALQLNLLQDVDQAVDPEAEPALIAAETKKPSNQSRRPKTTAAPAPQAGSGPVVVKSIPDAKRSDRFYTSIRLPRDLWNQAGFGPEDRLLLDWSGRALTIERATEGGVKPKAIGETSVVLQSWKLGNLNFDQTKATETDGGLRLTGRRQPA